MELVLGGSEVTREAGVGGGEALVRGGEVLVERLKTANPKSALYSTRRVGAHLLSFTASRADPASSSDMDVLVAWSRSLRMD